MEEGHLIKTSPLINSVLVSSLLVDLTGTKLEIPVEGELVDESHGEVLTITKLPCNRS